MLPHVPLPCAPADPAAPRKVGPWHWDFWRKCFDGLSEPMMELVQHWDCAKPWWRDGRELWRILRECGRKELAGWFVHMQQLQKPVNHHWLIGGCLQNSLRQLSNRRRIKVDLRDFYRISFPPRSWRILEARIGMWLFKCTSPAPARGVCPCKPTMPWCGLAALELGVGM